MDSGYREWLTMKQAAESLQVHPRTVERWIRRGLVKASQPVRHGHIRVSAVSIERLRESSRPQPNNSPRRLTNSLDS